MEGLILIGMERIMHMKRKRREILMELENEYDEMLDDDEELCLLRSYELHFRVESYTEEYLPRYTEKSFFRAYRMTRRTFTKLLSVLCSKANFVPENLHGKKAIPAEKRLLLTIRYLATKKTLFEIGELFNVAESTACSVVEQTLEFLQELQPYVLKWPGEEDAQRISQEFEEVCGFPGVIGAMDGCHIEVKVSNVHRSDYTNRKFRQSVILLAVGTYSKILTYVYIGFPGRAHDSRALQNSSLWDLVEIQGKKLFYDDYFLIADSAFQLKTWAITPFKRTANITPQQTHFNKKLSSGRVCIENLFSWLKGRWRRLKYIDVNSLQKITDVISGCCTLHNFCIIQHDYLPANMVLPEAPVPVADFIGDMPDNAAILKRNGLMQGLH